MNTNQPTEGRVDTSRRGEKVTAKHPGGRVGEFEIVSTWTSADGVPMMTITRPGGLSWDVPAAEVVQDPNPEQARAAWIAGMRALLDMLDGAPQVPLPHFAKDKVSFYVDSPLLSARIAKRLTGYEVHDRPGHVYRYETTGRLEGVDVAVYVGRATGVSV